ncbi:hypothetical protein WJ971_25270 [Achromobacter xylosoxidans]
MQYDVATGTLQAESGGRAWVLVRASTRDDAFDGADPGRIAAQIAQDRQALAGADLLVAGGPLYAAAGRAQAAAESGWIGAIAMAGIVLVLLLALRRWLALLALVPVAVGLLAGTVACVAVFGSIHALTLVIGASLIGVAVDFPMHWLGKSYGMPDWRAWPALRRVLPGLTISLAASLVGYVALAFTPFPALTQTAVFSAAGLLGAYACTVCQLPAWLARFKPRPWPPLLRFAQAAWPGAGRRAVLWSGALLLATVTAGGIGRLDIRDDLRQWLSLPAPLLQQARQIGEITGFVPTSQFFLVRAPDADELLRRQARVSRRDALVGAAAGYTALSQRVAPQADQQAFADALGNLADRPEAWRALTDIGVPEAALRQELRALAALPPIPLESALQGQIGERWRTLWLGRHDGEVAGMITLLGLRDAAALTAIAQAAPGVTLVDRSGELNRMFSATRVEAAELKLLSYLVAAVLLCLTLGRAAAWRILAVPLAATACSLAALGYLGQPLTLFSLFGLLLVSAIGVDYAIFMFERVAGAAASLVGIMLGALTTLLSFGLLAVSRTPAIANFALAWRWAWDSRCCGRPGCSRGADPAPGTRREAGAPAAGLRPATRAAWSAAGTLGTPTAPFAGARACRTTAPRARRPAVGQPCHDSCPPFPSARLRDLARRVGAGLPAGRLRRGAADALGGARVRVAAPVARGPVAPRPTRAGHTAGGAARSRRHALVVVRPPGHTAGTADTGTRPLAQ